MRALELSPSANENIDSSIKGPEESNHNPVPEMHEEELKVSAIALGCSSQLHKSSNLIKSIFCVPSFVFVGNVAYFRFRFLAKHEK